MRLFSIVVESETELRDFLSEPAMAEAGHRALSVLVQVYVGNGEDDWISQVIETVRGAIPAALVIGASSAGEICEGRVTRDSTGVSVMFFYSSKLTGVALPCARGAEFSSGQTIAGAFGPVADLRGILLLAPPTRLDCSQVLQGIQSVLPSVTVFGGGAADDASHPSPRVFLGDDSYNCGCVAVALSGGLEIEQHVIFSWKALGPKMTLTDVRGFEVRAIDGKPAVDTYSKYLRIDSDDDDIFLLEFPLLIERNGVQIARNPFAMTGNGCVGMVADVHCGETARLGYLDIDASLAETRSLIAHLERCAPEAILVYSCICRLFTLQQDVEFETRPIQAIAQSAGFFTYGEFARVGGHLQTLNSSQVVVSMRESDATTAVGTGLAFAEAIEDRYSFRHSRITSRLFSLVTALTEELQEANRKLRFLAEHDALTGAFNRHALNAHLETEWERSKRYHYDLAILLLDLDHFKQLNDQHGHRVGDLVLTRSATVIQAALRASDSLYRYGGEEFLILLPETGLRGALEVGDKIRQAVETMVGIHERDWPTVTCSIGIASYPADTNDLESLLKIADCGLYQAKALGRNRVIHSADAT